MVYLLKKEISAFFSSLTGYMVIVVFLVINGLFMWVFPGDTNVLESGYATLDTFFMMAPWVFLFLIPAVTMRSFAEENKSGTMEFLLTKPLSYTEIVMAKFLGSLVLVLLSLLPCLIFFYSVSVLGNPPGNLDKGAIVGAFIGLFLLAAIYVSIGVFASSLTQNQVVAFVIAVIACFILYIGFESLAMLPVFNNNTFILNLGINEHYKSISRGVIDSRDLIYYLGMITIFFLLTKTRIQSHQW
ncbi:MAG TPA: gliding motility-associated ABC transporter permease subunit GldF [Bacteroidales bacterium]|nr:gliding motility-associated ABC transporter permease subunit GldF [Bacteroidales bacterium]